MNLIPPIPRPLLVASGVIWLSAVALSAWLGTREGVGWAVISEVLGTAAGIAFAATGLGAVIVSAQRRMLRRELGNVVVTHLITIGRLIDELLEQFLDVSEATSDLLQAGVNRRVVAGLLRPMTGRLAPDITRVLAMSIADRFPPVDSPQQVLELVGLSFDDLASLPHDCARLELVAYSQLRFLAVLGATRDRPSATAAVLHRHAEIEEALDQLGTVLVDLTVYQLRDTRGVAVAAAHLFARRDIWKVAARRSAAGKSEPNLLAYTSEVLEALVQLSTAVSTAWDQLARTLENTGWRRSADQFVLKVEARSAKLQTDAFDRLAADLNFAAINAGWTVRDEAS